MIAFQPLIAAAREASGVWSLITPDTPISIDEFAIPIASAAGRRRP